MERRVSFPSGSTGTVSRLFLAHPPIAPKVMILPNRLQITLMIDCTQWPYRVLLIRGMAEVDTVEGVSPAYAAAAERYFGEE